LVLSYISVEVRSYCESEQCAFEKFGKEIAEELKVVLWDLAIAKSIGDLPEYDVYYTEEGFMEINLIDDFYLKICSVNGTIPRKADGSVNWIKVTRIKILDVHSI
jgi:hypothetical protein